MVRGIVGVLLGYVAFAGASVLLFRLTGVEPHEPSAIGFRVVATLAGIVFALAGGVIACRMARTKPVGHAAAVGVLIALGAGVSLFTASGSHWTQIAALLLFAPATVGGGVLAATSGRG